MSDLTPAVWSIQGLRRFVQQLAVQFVPVARDLAFGQGSEDGALRLGQVAAVVVLAAAQVGLELDEGAFQHAFGQVVQAEFLEAGESMIAAPSGSQ